MVLKGALAMVLKDLLSLQFVYSWGFCPWRMVLVASINGLESKPSSSSEEMVLKAPGLLTFRSLPLDLLCRWGSDLSGGWSIVMSISGWRALPLPLFPLLGRPLPSSCHWEDGVVLDGGRRLPAMVFTWRLALLGQLIVIRPSR